MSFNAEGKERIYINEFERAFWRRFIGILVSIFIVAAVSVGLWLYY